MIKSLNKAVDTEEVEFYIEELDERDEYACFLAACGVAANPCLSNACGVACIGITACLLGLHTI